MPLPEKCIGPPWAPAKNEPRKPNNAPPIEVALKRFANGDKISDARADFFCNTWTLVNVQPAKRKDGKEPLTDGLMARQ